MTLKVKEQARTQAKVHYDKRHDILYLGLKEGEEDAFVEIASGVNVELNEKKEIIGIEFLSASKSLKPLFK